MTIRLPLALAASMLSACTLNFDAGIPCDDSTQCPTPLVCDGSIGRCERIEGGQPDGSDDVAEDVARPDIDADDVAEVSDDIADVSDGDDGGDVETDAIFDGVDTDSSADVLDASDASDASSDAEVSLDTEGDVDCVPTAEICDELDNDCNGIADDGIDCTSACGPGATLLSPTFGSFCIDRYEASRRDATDSAGGVDGSIAVSRAGVIPWGFVPYETAVAACTAAGKRLCTPEEWQFACGGPEPWGYPYNRSIYGASSCNGINVAPRDAAVVTGQFALCTNPETGTFDMSGNLSEWASDQGAHGGDFSDGQALLRCNGVNRDISTAVAEPGVGFRCCADSPL